MSAAASEVYRSSKAGIAVPGSLRACAGSRSLRRLLVFRLIHRIHLQSSAIAPRDHLGQSFLTTSANDRQAPGQPESPASPVSTRAPSSANLEIPYPPDISPADADSLPAPPY